MIALSAHLISIRAALMAVGSERLAALLSRAYREVAEIAVATEGQILPLDARGLSIIWGESDGLPQDALPQDAIGKVESVWDLLGRLEALRESFLREEGLPMSPRFGIAMTNGGSRERGRSRVEEGPESVIDRAHLLQRAGLFYQSPVLLDDASARVGSSHMQIREIDRLTGDGDALLLSPEARKVTMLSLEEVHAYQGACEAVHELMGPRGRVSPDRMGAAMAMQGALELYRQGEWNKAAAVLTLLASDTRPNPLARIYLKRCHAKAGGTPARDFLSPKLQMRIQSGDGRPPLSAPGDPAA